MGRFLFFSFQNLSNEIYFLIFEYLLEFLDQIRSIRIVFRIFLGKVYIIYLKI